MVSEVLKNVILAIIQGISEWFPISSDGHLVLFSFLLGSPSSLEFIVALHFGTLMSVFVYFGRDITNILEDILKGKWKTENSKMGFLIAVSAIPAALIGFLFKRFIETTFTSLLVTAIGFGITSLSLFIASMDFSKKQKEMGYRDAFLMGVAQIFAMLPGISRSGMTISSGLLLGLDEKKAVRFSFLMSVPVIFGAGLLELGTGKLSPDLILPTLISFVVGLLAIHLLLKIISRSRKNLRWFGLYCILLSLIIILWLILK